MQQQKKILDMVPRKQPPAPKQEAAPARPAVSRREPVYRERSASSAEAVPRRIKKAPSKGRGKLFTFSIAILLIAGLAFGAMTYFANAQITVTPKTETVALQADLTANLDSGGDLAYKVMTLESDATTTVAASTSEDVESKATGTVTIYNNYSSAPYRLIKNTRLQSSSGLIFKITDTVVIPGKTMSNGTTTPGSASAQVFADANGPDYNVGLADFTIPGFKGEPQYSAFYARSKTPIEGGWSGEKNIASDADIAVSSAKLESSLEASLGQEALSEVPDGYVLLSGASATSFSPNGQEDAGKGVQVSEHGTWKGALFSKADISKIVIQDSSQKLPMPAEVEGIESLAFAPKSDIASALENGTPLSFALSGSPIIKANVSVPDLQKAIAGSSKSALQTTIAQFPGIGKVDAQIFPFWKNSFPKDPQKITIVVQ